MQHFGVYTLNHDHTGDAGDGGQVAYSALSGYPALTSQVAVPSGNVALTDANTWYDVCSLALAAGTWLLTAHLNVIGGVAYTGVGKIYLSGTPNTGLSEPAGAPLSTSNLTLPLLAVVAPGSTLTYILAALSTTTGSTATKTNSIGSADGPATTLIALRIA